MPAALTVFLNAWRSLNLEREDGPSFEVVVRIKRSQIAEYIRDHGRQNDPDFCEELRAHVAALDSVYVPWERERRRKELIKARAKANSKGRNGKDKPRKFR